MRYHRFQMTTILLLMLLPLAASAKEDLQTENEEQFQKVLIQHLNAVSNKDLQSLRQTLSPQGNMQLILPQAEISQTVDEFVLFHKNWFAMDSQWTFETKVLNTKVGPQLGMAVVEIIYREPERDGKPYFNRMIVSYVLEKVEGQWYFIKDHASSVEKSTDVKP